MKTNTLSSHQAICRYVWYPITGPEVTTVPYCQETNIIQREITHQEGNTATEMQLPGHLWDFQSSVHGWMCVRVVDMCITALMFSRLNWILCWRTVNLEYVQDANDWCDYIIITVGFVVQGKLMDKIYRRGGGAGEAFIPELWRSLRNLQT